jgi:hypothetical protein
LRYHSGVPGSLQIFVAKIYKVGVIRYVDVPATASKALGVKGAAVPVCGSVEAVPLRTTMVSRGNGCYRLAIHGDIRKKLRIDAGAVVEVALEIDEEPREPALPPAMVLALRNSPKAQTNFRAMTTALRRQIVRYITSVKQQSTLERRVAGIIRRLETRERPTKRKGTANRKRRKK